MIGGQASSGSQPIAFVVDDEATIRVVAGHELRSAGFVVHLLSTGEAAVELGRGLRPDLILLDVQMPGIDGFETCRRLRELPGFRDVAVLMATAADDLEAVERAFEAGATDFITKPIPWHLFRRRIRFLLRASRALVELNRTVSALSASERRLSSAQRLARVGHWECELDRSETIWSNEVYRILGHEPLAIEPSVQSLLDATFADDRAAVEKAIADAIECNRPWSIDHRIERSGGVVRSVHHQGEVVRDELTGLSRLSGTIQDVTERKEVEEEISRLARHDDLTGLPNRRFFNERLEKLLDFAIENQKPVAVLFIDIDRFKRINDTLGHAVGDVFLRSVSDRILDSVRLNDGLGRVGAASGSSIARFGGDEFVAALLLRRQDDVGQVGRRILRALDRPIVVEGHEVAATVSIGVSFFPEHGRTVDELLRCADVAMYEAKARGRNAIQTYSTDLAKSVVEGLEIESGLKRALERNEFFLQYQPKFDARSRDLLGFEALLRWNCPGKGLVSPGAFIPIAEESGLIEPIGEWVLNAACAQQRAWRDAGMSLVRVSVNLSPRQLHRRDVVESVASAMRAHGVDGNVLELEITESSLMYEPEAAGRALHALKDLGVTLSLDDFGTGYSSFAHLKQLPIDTVKIDKSFVDNLGADRQDDAIVAAIVAMATKLGLSLVAEGVETAEQVEALIREGCYVVQGYFFGRPMSATDAMALLAPRRPV